MFLFFSQLRQFEFKEELLPQYDLELMNKADGFLVDVALYDEHCNNAKDKIKVMIRFRSSVCKNKLTVSKLKKIPHAALT